MTKNGEKKRPEAMNKLEVWVRCPNLPKGQKDGYHSRCGNWESGPCPCLSGDHPGLVLVSLDEALDRALDYEWKRVPRLSTESKWREYRRRELQLLFQTAFGGK